MLLRNMLAMEVEDLLRSYPIDGVVSMGGCDKSTPGPLLGATSADLPGCIQIPGRAQARAYLGRAAR
jgi:dihydroxy-acid dehydratase